MSDEGSLDDVVGGREGFTNLEKMPVYLIMAAEKIVGQDQQSQGLVNHHLVELDKVVEESKLLKMTVEEFKNYMLSDEPDLFGNTYSAEQKHTVESIMKAYEEQAKNPNKTRVDIYAVPADPTTHTHTVQLRLTSVIGDLADKIIKEIKDDKGVVTGKSLSAIARIQEALGKQYASREKDSNLYLLARSYAKK